MKKVLVLLTFFFFIPIIHANDSIGCIYEVENCRVTFMVKSKKNEKKGTVDVNIYDLRSANIGYMNNNPVLVDYASFNY